MFTSVDYVWGLIVKQLARARALSFYAEGSPTELLPPSFTWDDIFTSVSCIRDLIVKQLARALARLLYAESSPAELLPRRTLGCCNGSTFVSRT